MNEKMDSIINGFEKHLIDNKNFDCITNEECKEVYNSIISNVLGIAVKSKRKEIKQVKTEYDVISFFDFYIETFTKIPSPSKRRKIIKKDSMKGYKSSKQVVEAFMTENNIKKLNFEYINRKFYDEFYNYMLDKNYSLNYIGTIIQKLKTILKASFDFDYHTNIEFQKAYFSKVREDISHPYLDLDEIELISNLVLDDELDDIARDIFVIQCNTGMRIQDLLDFLKNPQYIDGNNGTTLLYKKQNKTGGDVFAPLNKNIKKIIEKRNNALPPYLHQAEINIRIKEICRKAKITTPYTLSRTIGREIALITKPKCEFIATHTARRSFCTNAFLANVPPHLIMLVSGHKSEKTFMLYVKADLKQKASILAENEYFQ